MTDFRFAVGFVLLAAVFSMGCQGRSVLDGPSPPPVIVEDGNTQVYSTRFAYTNTVADPQGRAYYLTYYADAADQKLARNEILFDLIGFVDTAHSEYESSLRFHKAFSESGFDITEAALTLATAVTGGEQAKTVLSAINLFVQGTEAAIDQAFYREKLVEALQLEARKNRAEVLNEMYQRLDRDLAGYPLDAGLRDIARLYYAGSVTRAIQTLAETAAEAAKEAEDAASNSLTQ